MARYLSVYVLNRKRFTIQLLPTPTPPRTTRRMCSESAIDKDNYPYFHRVEQKWPQIVKIFQLHVKDCVNTFTNCWHKAYCKENNKRVEKGYKYKDTICIYKDRMYGDRIQFKWTCKNKEHAGYGWLSY